MRAVLINGEVVTPETATYLGFRSRFPFMAIRSSRPFAPTAASVRVRRKHLQRLARSAERVFIPLPVELEIFADEVQRGTRLAANPESYIRVMVDRGRADGARSRLLSPSTPIG